MSQESSVRIPKTKQQYSKNVKILKYQLQKLQDDLRALHVKVSNAHSIDNNRILAIRFAKQCRIRKFTPEMIFRFADTEYVKEIDEITFRNTLKQLKFNLSPDEIHKITLLIDEDMSGKLTLQEYIEYLEAFNINAENPKAPHKLINQPKKRNISQILGKDRMIDFQEYYKYMKDKFPLMKQKQIRNIFNELDPHNTGKISLNALKKLINKLLSDQPQNKKPKSPSKHPQKNVQKQDKASDVSSIQKKIGLLFKYRQIHSKLFHMIQFKKVGVKLDNLSSFVKLFRQIDTNKIGSFNFIDFMKYYLNKKAEKTQYKIAYEIMSYKLKSENMTVQQMLFRHGFRDNSYLTEQELTKILFEQFGIDEYHSKKIYQELQKDLPDSDKRVRTSDLLAKFNYKDDFSDRPNPNDLMELNYFGTKKEHFLKKDIGSIVFSPFLALKFCLHLQSQILAQKRQKWMDPQFGVNLNDRCGFLSVVGKQMLDVDFGIDQDDLTWNRVQQLGMKQFYNIHKKQYKLGKIHNPEFVTALTTIPEYYSNFLWNQLNPPKNLQKLTQKQLIDAFSGIYPKAFHYFAKYGIYVFRYFINNRFVYVLIDNYIPTMTSKQIIFSSAQNSWISLIQKAYAKVQGSYANMLNRQSIYQVIYELGHLCPMDMKIPPKMAKSHPRNDFWKNLNQIFSSNQNILISCFNDENKGILKCLDIDTQLLGEESVQIIYTLQIQSLESRNDHKSHRLVILKFNKKINDKQWNPNWTKKSNNSNKYDKNFSKIEKLLKQQGKSHILSQLQMSNVVVLNFMRFRSLYDNIYYLENLESSKWYSKMTLDRMLKERGDYLSEFRVQSRMKSDVIISFLKKVERQGTITITFGERNKKPIISKRTIQDFVFIKIPMIEANIEYVVSIYCKQEIIDFFVTVHLETRDFKIRKSNGPAIFHDCKKIAETCAQYKDTDPKVKEYLEKKLFDVVQKKKTGCCG